MFFAEMWKYDRRNLAIIAISVKMLQLIDSYRRQNWKEVQNIRYFLLRFKNLQRQSSVFLKVNKH